MSRWVPTLLLLAAGMLYTETTAAAATASATLINPTRSLEQTGFRFEQVGVTPLVLAPGQSADHAFSIGVSVQDSGVWRSVRGADSGRSAARP